MAFQPFGYRFEISSLQSPDTVKAALRARTKDWFDMKDGPRGWVVGPYMCLWNSAFDHYGPMVVGRISRKGFRTIIRGRAGSDINGMVMLALWTPVMAFLLFMILLGGLVSNIGLAIVTLIFTVALPFSFWLAHEERRNADSLIQFIRRAVKADETARGSVKKGGGPLNAKLIVNGELQIGAVTTSDIEQAIRNLSQDDFIILDRDEDDYLQARLALDRFIVEKREGDAEHHFQVELPKGDIGDYAKYDRSVRLLVEICADYALNRASTKDLNWKQIHL